MDLSAITFYSRGKMELPNMPDVSFVTFDNAPLYGVATLIHISNYEGIPNGRYFSLYSDQNMHPHQRVRQAAGLLSWVDDWFDNTDEFNSENHDKGCARDRATLRFRRLDRECPDLGNIIADVLFMTVDEFKRKK